MAVTRVDDAAAFLFGTWKARPRGKRILTALALAMAVSGAVMLMWGPITGVYSSRTQTQLAEQFVSPEFKTKFQQGEIAEGEVLTRIVIESIGVDALIVEGSDVKALRAGAGHYPTTALPCAVGNVGIAGHRTTYGKPFGRLDEVKPGDRIVLVTPSRRCSYRIVAPPGGRPKPSGSSAAWVTEPDDIAVIGPMNGSFLTLTTCHPKGSAAKRLIVRAQLESGEPA